MLLLIFGVGVLAGIAGDRFAQRQSSDLMAGEPEAGSEAAAGADTASEEASSSRDRWIIHRVDLSPDQRMVVDSVLGFYRAQVRGLTDDYNDAYWSAVESTRDELREILREEQRLKYDSLLVENDRRRGRGGND
ncbi:MAG: hypothetical protein EA350_01160 [Gemmatimonadales bacterium]|nr:MAG: hypothetical protein EA350_01160 [Gemmatimonadales bacterium]